MRRMSTAENDGLNRLGNKGIMVMLVPIMYVIMWGPVVCYIDSCPVPVQRGLGIIFSPLDRINVSSTPAGKLLRRYTKLWGNPDIINPPRTR